jgi:hypothetical protein
MKHLMYRFADISNCFDKFMYCKEIFMKKILSALLVVFAVGAFVIGCKQASQDDATKVDDKAVGTDAAKTVEEAK